MRDPLGPRPNPEMVLAKLLGDEPAEFEQDTEHHWVLYFGYAMSHDDVAEFMSGERPDGSKSAWRPSGVQLERMFGPDCLRCERSWIDAHDQPCPGVVVNGPTRADRRRADRLKAKRGPQRDARGEELEELLRSIGR